MGDYGHDADDESEREADDSTDDPVDQIGGNADPESAVGRLGHKAVPVRGRRNRRIPSEERLRRGRRRRRVAARGRGGGIAWRGGRGAATRGGWGGLANAPGEGGVTDGPPTSSWRAP